MFKMTYGGSFQNDPKKNTEKNKNPQPRPRKWVRCCEVVARVYAPLPFIEKDPFWVSAI